MSPETRSEQIDILYVITKSNWGGAQRYVYELATHMSKHHRVGVALGGNGKLAERLTESGVPVFPVPAFERDISFVKEFHAAWQLFKIFKETQPRIVHLNSSKAGGLGALIALCAGVPKVVFTSHGLTFEEDRVWWQKTLIAVLTWVTFMFSDKVILVSEANHRTATTMPLIGDRLLCIRLGISPVRALTKQTARAKLKEQVGDMSPTRGALWIGTVAELTTNKGLSYLIEALKLLSEHFDDFVCVIIGGGELKESLEQQIADLGLKNNVFLAGFVENAATYLSAFDVVTLTSIKEGLPYVALEAGSIGSAFVGSSLPGIQEVVTDMQSGILIRPKEPPEIAGALLLMAQNKLKRSTYGQALQDHVAQTFALDRMLTQTGELYKTLLP